MGNLCSVILMENKMEGYRNLELKKRKWMPCTNNIQI